VLAGLAFGRALPSLAQPVRRDAVARIAILDDATEDARRSLWASFRDGLREKGFVEGRNLVIAMRFAQGRADRLPALAAELVATRPDAIVTVTTTAAIAAKQATSRVPIVAIGPADPVKSGLVASLGRPGGNLTGLAPAQGEIAGKWLELLRELLPDARSLVYLTDIQNPGEMLVYRDLAQRAQTMGVAASAAAGIDEAAVRQAFAAMQASRPDALVVATTASMLPHRRLIVDEAARARLPAIYARPEYAQAGGLVAYGADGEAIFREAGLYAGRILDGTPPAELPFQMASTFRLVLNLRTARALGLRIPPSVRVRADEVIE